MAWDTQETRRRLKLAAAAEFAQHGPDGTTMERIARRAGINKERLYNYFGTKQRLFATVLSDELAKVAAAVPVTSLREEDIGEYAGRVFDYHADNPRLTRLLLWEGLAYGDGEVPDEAERSAHYRAKTAAMAAAQADGLVVGQPVAGDLMFFIIALAAWWHAAPQMARMLTGASGRDRGEHERRRAAVVQAARRLTGSPG